MSDKQLYKATKWRRIRSRAKSYIRGHLNVAQAVSLDEHRVYIKIELLREKTGKEINEQLCEACGESAFLFDTVYRWIRQSADSRFPTSPVADCQLRFHVEKVRNLLTKRSAIYMQGVSWSLGISVGSVHTILTHNLWMRQYLNRIVAIDETWLRSYEPEFKSQSSEWHTSGSPKTAKLRRKQGNLKQLTIIVLW